MPQTQNLNSNEEFDIGPVSATAAGSPAPLPGPVVFSPSGPITLIDVNPETVTVRATGAGAYSVSITSGNLSESVDGTITAVVPAADALVVPLSPVRPQI